MVDLKGWTKEVLRNYLTFGNEVTWTDWFLGLKNYKILTKVN